MQITVCLVRSQMATAALPESLWGRLGRASDRGLQQLVLEANRCLESALQLAVAQSSAIYQI